MLYFIIPLKCELVSSDWDHTCELLESTIRSVCNQSSKEYRVIVVCHDRPLIKSECAQVCFVDAPFESPNVKTLELPGSDRMFQFRSDKGRKLLRGLEIAREDEADYVMFVDADDFVHRDVCAFVHDVRHPHGWMIYHGYRMDEGRDWIAYRRSRFHKECGSSHILKTELAPFPTEVNYTLDFGDYFIRRYEVHAHLAEAMAAANQPLARLPFFGAVYYLNRESIYAHSFRHPDSVMRKFARCALKGRFVTTSFRRNFGIS